MRAFLLVLTLMTLASVDAQSQGAGITAFINVNVVTMDRDQILRGQTVVIRDGMIAEMGPTARIKLTGEELRIDGEGKAFLLPGLADMHSHVATFEDLALYTASGVTTLLHMGMAPSPLVALANQLTSSGKVVGPQIYFALMVDGRAEVGPGFATTPEQARAATHFAKLAGYDFIKVYNSLRSDVFSAFVDEGKQLGIATIGHGVRAVGLPQGLFQGQVMVAHAEEFYYTAFENKKNLDLIPTVVADTLRSGAYVTPNLSAFETITSQWGKPEIVTAFFSDPRVRALSPAVRMKWSTSDYVVRKGNIESILKFLQTFTKALHDAGVPLLAGTDSPDIPGMLPGSSLHEDLRTLTDLGLTPYEALSAATRTPGEFVVKYVPGAKPFGKVQVGMGGDLILAARNPLETLDALKSPLGVMTGGRWLSASELASLLQMQASKYDAVLK